MQHIDWRPRTTLRAAALLCLVLGASAVTAADTVQLYAAGSLKLALTDVAKAYEAKSGTKVEAKWGASGLLKNEIAAGAKTDIFASANMEHPQALHDAGKSGAVILFTRNRLCALVRPGFGVDTDTLLERMLDPNVKLASSTPKSDPSGDYAFEVFAKAEAVRPGAKAALEKKALLLVGAANSPAPPPGRSAYAWHIAEDHADIFLTYCTNTVAAQKEAPGAQLIALPPALSVGADYGLTVMNGAAPAAQDFAGFIMSPDGQKILASHGFAPLK